MPAQAVEAQRIVVVGAGQAGGDAVAALKMGGHLGEITLVGEEPHLPYSRPPLSKAYLSGEADEDAILLRDASLYESQSIAVRSGERVTSIDRTGHRVLLGKSEWLPYDKLILATGGSARRLEAPELAGATNVLTLRTVADARALRERLVENAKLVIIGGGYIGLEIAAAARQRRTAVTVLEAAPRVLARVTSPQTSEFFQTVHREEGVRIIAEARISRFETTAGGDVCAVHLEDGLRVEADTVLVGIGLLPRTELAETAGLAVENGVLVDASMRTSDPDIFAIGDVARHPDPQHDGLRRLESVPNASEQARVVASVIMGRPSLGLGIPWFWSDQYNLKLQVAGLSTGYDTLVVRQDPTEPRQITVLYLREGAVISADVVNRPADFAVAKKLITARTHVDPQALADTTRPLKAFLEPLPARSVAGKTL